MTDSATDVALIGDESNRVRLGANKSTPPELLYFLARDPSVTVRAAVALNQNTPAPADAVLANDSDDRVRAVLGRKIAVMASSIGDSGQDRLERVIRNLLTALVADEAERVRAMISDTLKDLPSAPPDIVRQLAYDSAISVSEPIIRFSPLITESDLLQLLSSPPCPGTSGAVARRSGLSEKVSDAIVATANSAAIRDLLCNHSASIKEETLDLLAECTKDNHTWREPLVKRPSLSVTSMRTLSRILADHLLEALYERNDLDKEIKIEIREIISAKLNSNESNTGFAQDACGQALAQAKALDQSGALTESALTQAIKQGDDDLVIAMIAVAANVAPSVVQRAVALRSAKGLVSLIWRSGFSMRSGVAIQALLARLPPRCIVGATPNGGFPLSADEMRWQIEFLEHAAR